MKKLICNPGSCLVVVFCFIFVIIIIILLYFSLLLVYFPFFFTKEKEEKRGVVFPFSFSCVSMWCCCIKRVFLLAIQ